MRAAEGGHDVCDFGESPKGAFHILRYGNPLRERCARRTPRFDEHIPVVIGGLVSATMLTLLVLPTVYTWLEERQGRHVMPDVA